MPSHLLAPLHAHAEPSAPTLPDRDYYPTILRQGGLTAWWQAGRRVVGDVELKAWFLMDDTRVEPDDIPETRGRIRQLYWHAVLYRERDIGGMVPVPSGGIAPVSSTEERGVSQVTAYVRDHGTDPHDGEWTHMGWIAMLDVDDAQTPRPD